MRRYLTFTVLLLFLNLGFSTVWGKKKMLNPTNKFKLPEPKYKSNVSVEEAILKRRSIRNYSKEPLKLEEVSQLLWAAQGITDKKRNFRAAPSAGALYPLETYIVVGSVSSIEEGIYKYDPFNHEILKLKEGDYREALSRAALSQSSVREGAVSIVFSAVYDRITERYGKRGIGYAYMEAGHAAQNIYLQAEVLKLGTVVVGAFMDGEVKKVIGMKKEETPLYILPVGKK